MGVYNKDNVFDDDIETFIYDKINRKRLENFMEDKCKWTTTQQSTIM